MLQRLLLTIWIVFAWILIGGAIAVADPAESETSDDDTDQTQSIEIDASIAAQSPFSFHQLYGTFDILFAPSGDLDKSGWRVQVGGEGETYIQNLAQEQASLLLGYSLQKGDSSLSLMTGMEVQNNNGGVVNRGRPVLESTFGWKVAAEFDTKPTQNTTFNAGASYSTSLNEYYSQVGVGYRVAQDMYLGPFVELLVNDTFSQGSVGGSFSGIKVGPAMLTVKAGYQVDFGNDTSADGQSMREDADSGDEGLAGLTSDTGHLNDNDDNRQSGVVTGMDVSLRY